MQHISNLRFLRIHILILTVFAIASCERETPEPTSTPSEIKNVSSETSSASVICDFDLNEAALIGWKKVFDENFADLNNWNIWYGGAYNNELQLYQSQNLQYNGGVLSINAVKETKVGPTNPFTSSLSSFNYTSGRIESKALYSAGKTTPKVRIAARIKLPSGYGMWPAFWSYGDPWPTQGEIDILEAKGQEPYSYYTNYFYGRAKNRPLALNASRLITSDLNLQECWHVFELIWSQTSLTYLLDGEIVDTKTGGYVSNLFGKKEKITLNLAVGGDFFGSYNPALIQTGTMQVDWVKVFTAK